MGLQQRWHGVFSGGYTLDMNFSICGSIANVSLIPTSTFGVVSFGGRLYVSYVYSLCVQTELKLANPILCMHYAGIRPFVFCLI